MAEVFFTYQTKDSVSNQSENNAPQLDLIEIEDESNLIIPAKNKVPHRNNLLRNKVVIPKDTLDADLEITNIPIRKANEYRPVINKEEKVITFTPSLIKKENTTWPVILLLAAILLIGFSKAFNSSRLSQIIKSAFSFHAAEEVVREEKVFFHRVNFSLFIVFIIVFTLFIDSLFLRSYLVTDMVINQFQIAGIIILMYGVKFLSLSILSVIFSSTQMIMTYIYNTLIYNYLAAIVLLPCMVLIYFSSFNPGKIISYAIIPALIIIFIYRLLRVFIVGRQNNVLNFYIILYICTLEILPLVVLGKIFVFK